MTLTDTRLAAGEVHRGNRIAVALLVAITVFATGSIVSLIASRSAADRATSTASAELRSELEFRKLRVIDYLEDVESNLASIASSQIAVSITEEFVSALESDGDNGYANTRLAYITNNPNPPGRRQALLYASDDSNYSRIHARYHDWLLSFSTAHDYYDMLIADAEGNIVYSVFKEDDFGTNLVTGEYRDTALAVTFDRVRDNSLPERAIFSNFDTYAPSNDLPAAFIGSPVMQDGKFGGAFIVQLKHSRLNRLLHADEAELNGIRAYLVGDDGFLRAGSGIASDEVMQIAYEQANAKAALSNRAGVTESKSMLGVDVLSAHAPLRWNGVVWALLVERDRSSVNEPVQRLRRLLMLSVLLCSVLGFVVGWLLADSPDPDHFPLADEST
ncbi:MAG: cache domain-containing protein [Granulosicoccus sp.]